MKYQTKIIINFFKYKSYFKDFDFNNFMNLDGKILRRKENRETLFFQIKNKNFYMKRFFRLDLLSRIKLIFFGNITNYSINNELFSYTTFEKIKISTPVLVGFGIKNKLLYDESFIISEELAHHQQLDTFIKNNKPLFNKFKHLILNKLSDTLIKLHKNKITHSDFYLCHFFIDLNLIKLKQVKLVLIDYHRVKSHKSYVKNYFLKDISAIFFSMIESGFLYSDLKIMEEQYCKEIKMETSDFKLIYSRSNKLLNKYNRKYIK